MVPTLLNHGPHSTSRGDYQRLLTAFTVSAYGSGIGQGALPLVAVLVLHVSTLQVALLAVISGAAAAMIALPFAPSIEFLRKRPAMMVADLVRFVALISVPVAALLGVLTYVQLCAVGVAQMTGTLVFSAASTAHLKGMVSSGERLAANATFASRRWLSQAVGPPLGGFLIGIFGATVTLSVDATSYLFSALGISRLRSPEPTPPRREESSQWRHEVTSGWHYILSHAGLRSLFLNAMLFGGSLMAANAVVAVFILRTLHLSSVDYGLVLGIPCAAGLVGSRLAAPLSRRFGQHAVLLWAGVLRAPWLLLWPLAPRGTAGLIVVLTAESGLLLSAGIFNPCFATYRMAATDDAYMVRVASAWSIASKAIQTAFIALGGVAGGVLGLRPMFAVAGVLCCASALLLPWARSRATEPGLWLAFGPWGSLIPSMRRSTITRGSSGSA